MVRIRIVLLVSIIISVFILLGSIFIFVKSNPFTFGRKSVSSSQNSASKSASVKQLSEKEIFDRIRDGVKEGEGLLLLQEARKISKKTDLITLSNCTPDILISQAQLNGSISFKNQDTVDRPLRISGRNLVIKAGNQLDVKTDFPKGGGMYSYFCNNSKTPTGVIVILPKSSN